MFFLFVCVGVLIFEEHALSTMAVLRPVVELDLASRGLAPASQGLAPAFQWLALKGYVGPLEGLLKPSRG